MPEATPTVTTPSAATPVVATPVPAQSQAPQPTDTPASGEPSSSPAPTTPPTTPTPVEAPPTAKDWNAIRAQEERIRREREELKTSAKEAEEARKFAAEVRRLAKENPEEAAKLAGLDYVAWTKQRLTSRKPDPVAEVRSELEKFKAETAAEKAAAAKAREDEQAAAVEAHWTRVRSDFSTLVQGSGERHEYLRAELATDADGVIDTLRAMAVERPDLTLEGAADLYEQFLSDRVSRYLATNKAKSLISPPPVADTKPSTETPRAEIGTESAGNDARTLTNSHAQERSTSPLPPTPRKSAIKSARDEDEERIRRALARVAA